VRLPAPQVVYVLEERRDPDRFAHANALEMPPKREKHRIGFAWAGTRVQQRKQQSLIQSDRGNSIVPVERRDHVELGPTPVPRVQPSDEGVVAVSIVMRQVERIDEQRLFLVIPVVEERKDRGVALALAPNAPVER